MIHFQIKYFILALLLLFTEIIIGLYAHDEIIRPYGGDFLVVILIYCLVKSFVNYPVKITALCVLLFCYIVETLQYFHIVNILGLEKSRLACIIIGTCFAWTDMLMYTLGIIVVLFVEMYITGGSFSVTTN